MKKNENTKEEENRISLLSWIVNHPTPPTIDFGYLGIDKSELSEDEISKANAYALEFLLKKEEYETSVAFMDNDGKKLHSRDIEKNFSLLLSDEYASLLLSKVLENKEKLDEALALINLQMDKIEKTFNGEEAHKKKSDPKLNKAFGEIEEEYFNLERERIKIKEALGGLGITDNPKPLDSYYIPAPVSPKKEEVNNNENTFNTFKSIVNKFKSIFVEKPALTPKEEMTIIGQVGAKIDRLIVVADDILSRCNNLLEKLENVLDDTIGVEVEKVVQVEDKAKLRAEIEAEVRAEIEAEVRAETRAEIPKPTPKEVEIPKPTPKEVETPKPKEVINYEDIDLEDDIIFDSDDEPNARSFHHDEEEEEEDNIFVRTP